MEMDRMEMERADEVRRQEDLMKKICFVIICPYLYFITSIRIYTVSDLRA